MLSKFQKAADKLKSFVFNTSKLHEEAKAPLNMLFRRHSSMAENSTSKVQALYDLCKTSFTPTGTENPPSSQTAETLFSPRFTWDSNLILYVGSVCFVEILIAQLQFWILLLQLYCNAQVHFEDTIGPADVGLKEENTDDDRGFGFPGYNRLNTLARWAQPITYIDIHEGETFTMCIFCFPTSAVIPLHDHPGMTVFSKVLYGSLHVKAYDWVEPACIRESKGTNHSPVRLAKLTVDKVLTAPCSTSVLYPRTGGNLHCFTAVSPCAVLDVLTPPYKEDAGRRCTYYHDYPYSSFSMDEVDKLVDKEENYSWLEEIETPDDLYMHPGRYTGPRIQW